MKTGHSLDFFEWRRPFELDLGLTVQKSKGRMIWCLIFESQKVSKFRHVQKIKLAFLYFDPQSLHQNWLLLLCCVLGKRLCKNTSCIWIQPNLSYLWKFSLACLVYLSPLSDCLDKLWFLSTNSNYLRSSQPNTQHRVNCSIWVKPQLLKRSAALHLATQ